MLKDITTPAGELVELSKRDSKKQELGYHALSTLAQWGYVGASMRTIAEEADVSLGIIHYYFEDKIELICYCVQLYKIEFARKITAPLLDDNPPDILIERYVIVLASSLEQDAKMHRLWFDIRTQAMFDERFQETVNEIEQSLVLTCETLISRLGITAFSAPTIYALIDGLFRYYMQMYLAGEQLAGETFRDNLKSLLSSAVGRV